MILLHKNKDIIEYLNMDNICFEIGDYYHSKNGKSKFSQQLFIDYELLSWINKNGEYVTVKNMSDNYIQNCLDRIIKRNWRTEWLEYFEKIQQNRKIKLRKEKLNIINAKLQNP